MKKKLLFLFILFLVGNLANAQDSFLKNFDFNMEVGVYQKVSPYFYKLGHSGLLKPSRLTLTDPSAQLTNSNFYWCFESHYEPFKLAILYKQNYRYDLVNFDYRNGSVPQNSSYVGKANKAFLLDQHIQIRKYLIKSYKDINDNPVSFIELGFSFNNQGSEFYEVEQRIDPFGNPYQSISSYDYTYNAIDLNFGVKYKKLILKLGVQQVDIAWHKYDYPSPFISPIISIGYNIFNLN